MDNSLKNIWNEIIEKKIKSKNKFRSYFSVGNLKKNISITSNSHSVDDLDLLNINIDEKLWEIDTGTISIDNVNTFDKILRKSTKSPNYNKMLYTTLTSSIKNINNNINTYV